MQYLHVETDALRETARAISIARLETMDSIAELQTTAYRVEAGWQGSSAQAFLEELAEWLSKLRTGLEELDQLERILAHQAEAWEESDQRWANTYREVRVQPEKEKSPQ